MLWRVCVLALHIILPYVPEGPWSWWTRPGCQWVGGRLVSVRQYSPGRGLRGNLTSASCLKDLKWFITVSTSITLQNHRNKWGSSSLTWSGWVVPANLFACHDPPFIWFVFDKPIINMLSLASMWSILFCSCFSFLGFESSRVWA